MQDERTLYDSKGRQVGEDVKSWNKVRKAWIGKSKYETKINAKGQRAQIINYAWDDNAGKWVNNIANDSEYDSKFNYKNADIKKVWRNGGWQNTTRLEYEYDFDTRRIVQTTEYEWRGAEWVATGRTRYLTSDPDARGNKTITTQKLAYDTYGKTWINKERTTSVVDKKQAEVSIKREEWNGKQWVTVKSEKTEIRYNANGEVTHEARYRWNGGNEWIGIRRSDMTYNDYGDVLSEIRMEWDAMSNNWTGIVNVKTEYSQVGQDVKKMVETITRKL